MPTTETRDIPTEGAHVRLDTDPRDVGIPPAMAVEGGRLVVEGTAIGSDGLVIAVRPIGEETTFRLRPADVEQVES